MGPVILPDKEYTKLRKLLYGGGAVVIPKSLADKYAEEELQDLYPSLSDCELKELAIREFERQKAKEPVC